MDHSAPIPHIAVNDGEAAIKFYEAAFGAACQNKHLAEDGKKIMHAHLQLGGGVFFLHDDFPEFGDQGAKAPSRLGGTSFVIHLEVPDADVAWERAVKAGAQIVLPLGAPIDEPSVNLNETKRLEWRGENLLLNVPDAARYLFRLDVRNPDQSYLNVTRLARSAPSREESRTTRD